MIRLRSARLFRANLKTRLPFRYGIATMTELPHVFLETDWNLDGPTAAGLASENLPPKWFTKDAERDPLEVIGEMEAELVEACQVAREIVSTTPFDFWLALYGGVMKPSSAPLLQHLGVTLVERSLLDAVCRHHATPLWQLVRENRLGLDLGKLSPELAGRKASEFLPSRPQSTATLRHTVGMADPLRESDIPDAERLDDGLPESLEACIAAYGLREFKLKPGGDAEADLARLRATAAVLTEKCRDGFAFSLDGNEQFGSAEQIHDFGQRVMSDPVLAEFFERLLFIEQPITRKAALTEDAGSVREAWPQDWQSATCDSHPDLYAPHPTQGWPALRIQAGRISLDSMNAAPLGVQPLFDPSPH